MEFSKRSNRIFIIITLIFSIILTCYFCYDFGGYATSLSVVNNECKNSKISRNLVLAIIKTESNFNKNALSNKGAVGLMQLTNSTASYIAKIVGFKEEIDLYNERVNIYLGVKYLEYLFDKFNDENVVICAYNAGETKVRQWLKIDGSLDQNKITFKETKNYLKSVKRRKNVYKILLN